MGSKVTSYVRRQFYLYWPRMGRLARATLYFGTLDLLLLLLWGAFSALRITRVTGIEGWLRVLTFVTAVLGLLLAVRWLRRKVLWRLRNRLIVTYVFIGVIPVVLLAAIGLISAYLFAWQFATFVATSDLTTQVKRLNALNVRAAESLSRPLASGQALTPILLERYAGADALNPQRTVTAWYGGKAVTLDGSPPVAPPASATSENSGLALENGRLLLRVAESAEAGPHPVTVISTLPLSKEVLERVAAQLGEVTISPFSAEADSGTQKKGGVTISSSDKPQARLSVGNESVDLDDVRNANQGVVRAGKLPPAAGRFDREITAYSTLSVVDWPSGKARTALLLVRTRPSLLWARLFLTVGSFARYTLWVLAVVAVVFALIELQALIIGLRLTRTITRSVAELYEATQHINRGDFAHRIQVRSDDQLAELEGSFNSMTTSLERLIAEQKEKQRLENELAIAQEVQAQLFPGSAADVPALELHGVCRPARTVSGDYYDFLPLEAGKVALAVGDVSGKGISAALLMATIHSAVRAYSLQASVRPALAGAAVAGGYNGTSLAYADGDLSPARLIALLNSQLYRSTPTEKYATLFFATYDGRGRTMSYCNAGHLPPIILRADGTLHRLDEGGTVVGLFDAMNYDEARTQLAPGDIFIAYSDGITEPENDFGEYGEQRVIELIRENRNLPLERISELLMAAVTDWIGGNEQPDDMTLVLARPR